MDIINQKESIIAGRVMAEKYGENSIKELLCILIEKVEHVLLDVGWKSVCFAQVQDLKTPLFEPEKEGRVFIVASK